MKNYCGILEHDYGCNCIENIKELTGEGFERFIYETSKFSSSIEEADRNIRILSEQSNLLPKTKRGSNLTPKKKKRKR